MLVFMYYLYTCMMLNMLKARTNKQKTIGVAGIGRDNGHTINIYVISGKIKKH